MLSHGRASRPPRARRSRTGASLAELLVALALAGVVVAAVARSRATSHAAATDALARAEARRQVAAGAGAVLATLRGAAPAGGDLLDLADSALELRITLGASTLCAHAPAAIDAPPSTTILVPSGARDGMAAWADAPDAGDRLLVMASEPVDSMLDSTLDRAPALPRRWRWHVAAIAGPGASVRTPCLGASDALALRIPLVAPLPAIVAAGAPVRLLRRGRWSVYRSGGRWYLGWRDVDARGVGLDVVQPVSGPHDIGTATGARRPALAFAVALGEERESGAGGPGSAALPQARVLSRLRALSLRVQSPAERRDGAPSAESLAIVAAFRNAPSTASP